MQKPNDQHHIVSPTPPVTIGERILGAIGFLFCLCAAIALVVCAVDLMNWSSIYGILASILILYHIRDYSRGMRGMFKQAMGKIRF